MSKDKKPEKEPVVVVKEIHHHHHYHPYPRPYIYPSYPTYPDTKIWCGTTTSGSQFLVNGMGS